jgi:hypothetical protein
MARSPIPSESEALERCGGLLRYAAENVKDIPKPMVSAITAAWDAEKSNTWDQTVATEFWMAFNSLCALIKPVTMDTISTNLREIPAPKWKFWRRGAQAISLSGRTAGRYMSLLTVLLLAAVFLGFLVSTGNRLSAEIEGLVKSGDDVTKQVTAETDALEATLKDRTFADAGQADQKAIALLQSQTQDLNYVLDRMLQKTKLMSRLMSFGFVPFNYDEGNLQRADKISDLRDAVDAYYRSRRDAAKVLLRTSVNVGVISSSVLPIILGLMGACAFVIRLISEQIKNSTFSSSSPVRHRVRVALGGLAGVVIGFGGVANASTLSSSALAFIAGYAVEPVFSTFDSIAEKFGRSTSSASGNPKLPPAQP